QENMGTCFEISARGVSRSRKQGQGSQGEHRDVQEASGRCGPRLNNFYSHGPPKEGGMIYRCRARRINITHPVALFRPSILELENQVNSCLVRAFELVRASLSAEQLSDTQYSGSDCSLEQVQTHEP